MPHWSDRFHNKKKRNGHPCIKWFITFPQSGDLKKEDLHLPPTTFKFICKEKHEDGKPHLHASIVLMYKKSKPKFIEWFQESYPNDWKRIKVDPTKELVNTINYCSKEDPFPFQEGEIPKGKGGRPKKVNVKAARSHYEHYPQEYKKLVIGLEDKILNPYSDSKESKTI